MTWLYAVPTLAEDCQCADCRLAYLAARPIQDEEPERCEADHVDGGVCRRRLTMTGHCPGEGDHA